MVRAGNWGMLMTSLEGYPSDVEDNEEHGGDVDGTDNTSDADTDNTSDADTLWGPTPDPEARDDELDSEPPRKCGRLV